MREIDRTVGALRELRKTLVAARSSARATEARADHAVVCRLIEGGARS